MAGQVLPDRPLVWSGVGLTALIPVVIIGQNSLTKGAQMNRPDSPGDFRGPKMETYTVKEGDTLSSIAKKFYGEGADYMIIYKANQTLIGDDPDQIQVGMELKIPSLK
jgi:nucleoid-associated protein YgaU